MRIILDSNVILRDPWWSSRRSEALLELLRRTRSVLVIPEVVRLEVEAALRRQAEGTLGQLEAAVQRLRRHRIVAEEDGPLIREVPNVEAYLERWRRRWDEVLADINIEVAVTEEHFRSALVRAVDRIPPCGRTGKEFRDALIWEAVIHVHGAADVVFISRNTRDFADDAGQMLAAQLLAEARERDIDLQYFGSLDSFLKEKAEPLAHVSRDWIDARLNHDDVEKELQELREGLRLEDIDVSVGPGWHPTGNVIAGDPQWTIDDWYVWEHVLRGEVDLFLLMTVCFPVQIECHEQSKGPQPERFSKHRMIEVQHCLGVSMLCVGIDDELHVDGLEDFWIMGRTAASHN